MKVIWTPEARQDRSAIWDHIASDNPRAAIRLDELFSDAAANLAIYPHSGRQGRVPGTHELIPHESYRLIYQIDKEAVCIPPGSGPRAQSVKIPLTPPDPLAR